MGVIKDLCSLSGWGGAKQNRSDKSTTTVEINHSFNQNGVKQIRSQISEVPE